MYKYTREELMNKIDIILDNMVDDKTIEELKERLNTWLSLEFTSGTISIDDMLFAREYGYLGIEIFHD